MENEQCGQRIIATLASVELGWLDCWFPSLVAPRYWFLWPWSVEASLAWRAGGFSLPRSHPPILPLLHFLYAILPYSSASFLSSVSSLSVLLSLSLFSFYFLLFSLSLIMKLYNTSPYIILFFL